MTKTVLLLGSTGNTGRNILRLLSQNSEYSIKLLVRDVEKAKSSLTTGYSCISSDDLKKIELIQGSLTDPTLPDAFDVDFIIHSAASNRSSNATEKEIGYEGMKKVIAEAKKSKNLKKIIYVTSGLVTRNFHPFAIILNTINTMTLKWKLQAENLLRESGLPYVICRPAGGLSDKALDSPIEFGTGDKINGTPVSRVSVGECVVKCLELNVMDLTFEMINNPKKSKTDWSELTSFPKDSQKTIHANHDLPRYLIFGAFLIGTFFLLKRFWI
jgi:hypothetical protein